MTIALTKIVCATSLLSVSMTTVLAADDYSDHRVVLSYAEFINHPDSDEAGGITVYQKDNGNGQLAADFVFNDPRRASFNGGEAGVNFAVDYTSVSVDPDLTNQAHWMSESVYTWTNLNCSGANISETSHNGNKGIVERYFNTGVINSDWGADLTQVGFRSAADFSYFLANPNVLGVTFTLTWVDGEGNPTDIDNNGKTDVAFREIYYNDEYTWSDSDTAVPGTIDFPTVAIHEVGHGISAAHFGMIAVKNGALFAKPRAIMNAIYGGMLRDLTGRDKGSHCSNWAQWPNN
ncbi:hypothetical protein [Thalassotalea sediminis]|uniref:hypothetical protein n=1 Tax=Thalassotalea sediminis TaxID=1759089 RepID=UPI002573840F|nr:hypothetical protein [Thalassotalea sediminis]